MTSKERAALKARANKLEPLIWVGKGGVSDSLIKQVNEVFLTRELIKLKVLLETAPDTPKNMAIKISEETGAEVVQVIGGAMIFYKHNPKLHEKPTEPYIEPISQKTIVKSKKEVKKSGTANRPNSKKHLKEALKKARESQDNKKRMQFTIKDSKNMKKPK